MGYLNEVDRNATPIALSAIFRSGDQVFAVHKGQRTPFHLEEADEFQTMFPIPKCISENDGDGRVLVYEDVLGTDSISEPPLIHEYLSASAETKRRQEIYDVYLKRAVALFSNLPNVEVASAMSRSKIVALEAQLEHLARCKPADLLARLALMAIACSEGNFIKFYTHYKELEFEQSRV